VRRGIVVERGLFGYRLRLCFGLRHKRIVHVSFNDGQHFVPVVGVKGYTSTFQCAGHVAEVGTIAFLA
jgi:hypothetical protein